MKKKAISITIREDIIEKLKKICEKENRNISNYIETILAREIKNGR